MDTTSRRRWENIATFFGAYLNQDFVDDYGGPSETVAAFKSLEPHDIVMATADEASELARTTENEQELRQTLLDFGLGYMLWADGWSSHAWLRHLAEQLRG